MPNSNWEWSKRPMSESEPREEVYLVEVADRRGQGHRFEVGDAGLLVGRSPTCDVLRPSSGLASRHAYFYLDDDELFVEDLSGADDLRVNGEQTAKARVEAGDMVTAGTLEMAVRRVPRSEMVSPPTAPDREPEPAAEPPGNGQRVSPLAVASLVFAVLAYQHWSFGLGATLLALFSLLEIRTDPRRTGRALAWGAVCIGLLGAGLNAWFEEFHPPGGPPAQNVQQPADNSPPREA
jgi:hypothetical protein